MLTVLIERCVSAHSLSLLVGREEQPVRSNVVQGVVSSAFVSLKRDGSIST